MNLSISFFNRTILLFAVICFLAGCARTTAALRAEEQPGKGNRCIAVLPVENLSGTAVPLKSIRQSLVEKMGKLGMCTLDEKTVDDFMAHHRMRYTGGIDKELSRAFKTETGAAAVLITSLELYSDVNPPKVALACRLVSTGENPVILGIDSVALSGDDSPGLLGLGLIEKPGELMDNALNRISASLYRQFEGVNDMNVSQPWMKKFKPRISYRSPSLDMEQKHTIAVIPFLNKSGRKNAGEILALQFVEQLAKMKKFNVIEPGIVRQEFLKFRIIMEGGVSLANADVIFTDLDADLIFTGEVMDYQDYQGAMGTPTVGFSIIVLDRKSREVVWASESYNDGDDRVYFFDVGKVKTAEAMASQMTHAVVDMMTIK
ncbi:hypothetical protein [Geotalea uraniireducens]|uniref:Lipoprotein n=1 Tax=Geotalea uraniireducens (strain Rf4) TaxID=351605 RepID=A5GFH8_GEOUR|nr:hypothetical protein [Geotalea uraniireducens]ABQ26183.1 hypothetical protein Gura_1993 [Geotalea uraniireducens Rf4]